MNVLGRGSTSLATNTFPTVIVYTYAAPHRSASKKLRLNELKSLPKLNPAPHPSLHALTSVIIYSVPYTTLLSRTSMKATVAKARLALAAHNAESYVSFPELSVNRLTLFYSKEAFLEVYWWARSALYLC